MELEESTFLTSGSTTKPQSLRKYGPGTKTEIQTNGTRYKQEINSCTHRYLIFDKGGKNINGANIASSINGAGKTGQLLIKQ